MITFIKRTILACTFFVLCISCCVTTANASNFSETYSNKLKVAVLFIGDSDIRSQKFMDKLKSNLKLDDENRNLHVVYGESVQQLYQDYWFKKGFFDLQPITPQDTTAFVDFSKYDRVLFVMFGEATINQRSYGAPIPSLGMVAVTQSSVSLDMKAVLADKNKMLKMYSITRNDNSTDNPLYVKRDVFIKCIKDLSKEFKPIIFNRNL